MRAKAAPSEHQQRPSFPPNRTRRAWTQRTGQETRPTGKLFPARREAQSVQSSPGVAAGEAERTARGGWEAGAQKATLRIRQSTRKSQTKLHICGEALLNSGQRNPPTLPDPRGLAAAGTYGSPRAKIQALRGKSTDGACARSLNPLVRVMKKGLGRGKNPVGRGRGEERSRRRRSLPCLLFMDRRGGPY